jgi:hypothetical protein
MSGSPTTIPEFTSDRMRLLAPCLTPLAIELGRRRVFEKGFRIVRRVKTPARKEVIERADGTPEDHKGALIVARILNPAEIFNGEEDAIYYGADRGTISGMRARGELAE